VVDSLPENDDACNELLEALVDWLPKRYPTLFEGLGSPGEGIWNKVTDEKLMGLQSKRGVEALLAISKRV
jgi:Haem-dependent oxidative N-demethylase, alpha subunit-like